MNVKHNINYFTKNENLKYIGLGIAIVSFALLWFGWGWIAYVLSTIGLPAGLVLFFIGTSARSDEADIDECIRRGTEGLEVDLASDRSYAKKLLPGIEPFLVGGNEYSDGLMFKKAKSGSVRSSVYTKALIYVLKDRLYISEKKVYIVEDKVDTSIHEILYDDIRSIDIISERRIVKFLKNSYSTRVCLLEIKRADKTSYSVPINEDIGMEQFVEKLNEIIDEHKKARAEGS